jgi:hypothetical protein
VQLAKFFCAQEEAQEKFVGIVDKVLETSLQFQRTVLFDQARVLSARAGIETHDVIKKTVSYQLGPGGGGIIGV